MPHTPLDIFVRATDALVKFNANFNSQQDKELHMYILELHRAEVRTPCDKFKFQCQEYYAFTMLIKVK